MGVFDLTHVALLLKKTQEERQYCQTVAVWLALAHAQVPKSQVKNQTPQSHPV